MRIKTPILTLYVFRAAVEGGFVDFDCVRKWADDQVRRSEQPDLFVINAALAKSNEDLLDILYEALNQTSDAFDGDYLLYLIGFCWLNYKSGRIPDALFLQTLYGLADLEDHSIYNLIKVFVPNNRAANIKKMASYFEKPSRKAQQALDNIWMRMHISPYDAKFDSP